MTVHIVCDSSCNLPLAYQHKLNVTVVPAWVNFADGGSFRNQIDISDDEFYRRLLSEKRLPTTSQPTPQDFVTAIEGLGAPDDEVIIACISTHLSGTYSSALQAVDLLPGRKVHAYDTMSVSMGAAWQVIAGAELAAQGADADAILARMLQAREQTTILFTIDTLKYLAASGRAPALQAMLGNLLDVKPMLGVEDGRLEVIGRVRGRNRSKRDLIDRIASWTNQRPVRAAIVNAHAPDEAAELGEMLKQRLDVQEASDR